MKRKISSYNFCKGLVNLHFYHLHIVFAATIALFYMHTAFATFFAAVVAKFNRINFVHAVMNRYHKTGANRKINKNQYGCGDFFHLHSKYNYISQKGKDDLPQSRIN